MGACSNSDDQLSGSPSGCFSDISAAARVLWAKSGDPVGHGLLAHMLDVAAVAEAILRRESPQTHAWAATSFGLAPTHTPRWVAAVAGLHDFGKAIPGFQFKWPDGQRADEAAGLVFRSSSLDVHRHDLAGAILLNRQLRARFPEAGWISGVCQALGAHHGYMHSSHETNQSRPLHEGPGWAEARAEILEAYFHTLAPGDGPMLEDLSLPALAWLAGLTSVADWIGSNLDWFPAGERADTLSGHHAKAGELAEVALDAIGWPAYRTLLSAGADTDNLIRRIIGQPDKTVAARPLQQVADALLAKATGPTLLIVEAPMGEGKTELALLAHLRLQATNGHRGLYLALPTQATGNAMFDRALAFLRGFAPSLRLDIQLAHGGALLDERIHRLREVDASPAESVASSVWFSQRKRPLLSPYGVGTVDQALFATLNVKHHFVRLWGLTNRVIVLDEIHAYDTYTSGLIEALLRWLKALGCSVVLMSATLPNKRRARLLDAWGAADRSDIPYPRILMVRDGETLGETVTCRPLEPIRVSGVAEELSALADAALACLVDGGCGLVVVNTVQRAQDLYGMLQQRGTDPAELMLFHARFPADERSRREHEVLSRFGPVPESQRPPRCLLIATQVAEQSLDLDFDFMFSDLAPMDLLLQRAGRLHRHKRERPPAHREPHLRISGLLAERPPELTDTAWGFVYDPYILYCSWAVALREPVWRLPEDIDRLVQAVYSQDPFEEEDRAELLATLDKALGNHYAEVQDQRQLAIHAAINAEAEPQNAYDKPRANEEREAGGTPVVTRLGDNSLTAVPVLVADDGWRLFASDAPFNPEMVLDDALARRIFARQVRISKKGVLHALLALPTQKGFDEHPLLRHLKPLPLRDGAAELGGLRVRLDLELGIVYEPLLPSPEAV